MQNDLPAYERGTSCGRRGPYTMRSGRILAWIVSPMVIVGAAGALIENSDRPQWFTVGGPLQSWEDGRPSFGPLYWKRGCIGFTWYESHSQGDWMACAGWPTGTRAEYRLLSDEEAWVVPAIPADMLPRVRAAVRTGTIQGIRGFSALSKDDFALLAWRNSRPADEVLLASRNGRSWKLTRVCLPTPTGERDGYDDFSPAILSSRESSHRPSDAELSAFVRDSGWSATDLHPPIDAWGLDYDAWTRTAASSDVNEYHNELGRLKAYVARAPHRAMVLGERTASAVEFVLKAGQQTVLPEDAADAVVHQCSRSGVPLFDATWSPTADDILQLEQRLPALNGKLYRLVPRHLLCMALRGHNLNDYHLQYSGMLERGRRLIYVNALVNGLEDDDWRRVPFNICDGGSSAWGVVYDVGTQTFQRFSINGSA